MVLLWRAAFEVASLADMEARLQRFGVEFHKFIVPGTNAAQIFLWDPEGCAVTARAIKCAQQQQWCTGCALTGALTLDA